MLEKHLGISHELEYLQAEMKMIPEDGSMALTVEGRIGVTAWFSINSA